ncbi:MAG: helix-turn-helix domain-containing protein [Paludibacteraceae bacterium]
MASIDFELLTTRCELSVQQVAYEFGFVESASFCRYFKRLTGQTPSQFRKGHSSPIDKITKYKQYIVLII